MLKSNPVSNTTILARHFLVFLSGIRTLWRCCLTYSFAFSPYCKLHRSRCAGHKKGITQRQVLEFGWDENFAWPLSHLYRKLSRRRHHIFSVYNKISTCMCAFTSQAGTLPKSIRCPRKVTVLNNYYLWQWLNQRTASVYSFACFFFIWRITHNTYLRSQPAEWWSEAILKNVQKHKALRKKKIEGTRVCRDNIYLPAFSGGARIAIASVQLFSAKITMCAHDFVLR